MCQWGALVKSKLRRGPGNAGRIAGEVIAYLRSAREGEPAATRKPTRLAR